MQCKIKLMSLLMLSLNYFISCNVLYEILNKHKPFTLWIWKQLDLNWNDLDISCHECCLVGNKHCYLKRNYVNAVQDVSICWSSNRHLKTCVYIYILYSIVIVPLQNSTLIQKVHLYPFYIHSPVSIIRLE